MATATLTEPDVVTTNGTMKRRAKRLGTITASLMALIALGVSFAFFVSNEEFGDNSATGGTLLVVGDISLTAENLFPTRAFDGGPNAVEDQFSISNPNNATVRYNMTAACSNCGAPDSVEQQQFDDLFIRILDGNREIYRGRLADMRQGFTPAPTQVVQQEAGLAAPNGGPVALGTLANNNTAGKTFTTFVWLNDDRTEQPQGVLNNITFTVTGRTV